MGFAVSLPGQLLTDGRSDPCALLQHPHVESNHSEGIWASLVAIQPLKIVEDSCGKCSCGHGGFTCAGRPPSSPHTAHSAAHPARLLAGCSLQCMQKEMPPLASYLFWAAVKCFICVFFCSPSEVFVLFSEISPNADCCCTSERVPACLC